MERVSMSQINVNGRRSGTVTFLVMRVYLSNILSPIQLLFTQDIVHQCSFCLNNISLTIQLLLKQRSFHRSSVLSSKNPFICPASTQPQILSSIQFLVNKGFFLQYSFYLSAFYIRQWLAYGHPHAKRPSLAYRQHVSKSCSSKVLSRNNAKQHIGYYVTHLINIHNL